MLLQPMKFIPHGCIWVANNSVLMPSCDDPELIGFAGKLRLGGLALCYYSRGSDDCIPWFVATMADVRSAADYAEIRKTSWCKTPEEAYEEWSA